MGTAGGTWGGMERHTVDLAGEMALSHEVHLLADKGYQSKIPTSVLFHEVDMAKSRRHPFLWIQLRSLLKAIRPEIAHAQGAKAAHLLSSHAGMLRKLGTRTIGTVHGTKTKHKAYQRLDGVIVVSRDIAARIHHNTVEVIPNGIAQLELREDALAACKAERRRYKGQLVLAIGRLAPVKGYDILLQAWPQNTDSHLLILGEGPQREALQQQIDDLGLSEKATLGGHSSTVPEWLSLADAMVISSRREGFPYALIEALQIGCPVLSTSVSGVSELLNDTFQAKAESVASLQALLSRELPELSTLKSRQADAIHRAREKYTLASMTRSTENFYQYIRDSHDF